MNTRPRFKTCSAALAIGLLALLQGCASSSGWPLPLGSKAVHHPDFKPIEKQPAARLLSKKELALFEESINPPYRIGSGDLLKLEVFGRPEVSGQHLVGPDGKITVPIMGDVFLNGLTREEALASIDRGLRQFFSKPVATLSVEQYNSNQITVLGRVERAGPQKFAQSPTLAEVLANAGAMPILDKQATLTRAAIMRGREQLIWVDLKALLNGDPAYNLRMKKGDIVFIPDSSETTVYVMGAVPKPGSYRLTPRMTLLDVMAQAGGPTEDAAPDRIGLYRAGSSQVEIVALSDLISMSRRANYALEDGDVVFVPKSAMANAGYLMRQLSPALSILTFGLTLDNLNK